MCVLYCYCTFTVYVINICLVIDCSLVIYMYICIYNVLLIIILCVCGVACSNSCVIIIMISFFSLMRLSFLLHSLFSLKSYWLALKPGNHLW